ncbi:hypothetical protein NZ30_15750 [Xanthomonas translucens pv. undulosa]|nr:hypothetical protein NZ30_15750 [Xanthomonas translucens pv. undulosa]
MPRLHRSGIGSAALAAQSCERLEPPLRPQPGWPPRPDGIRSLGAIQLRSSRLKPLLKWLAADWLGCTVGGTSVPTACAAGWPACFVRRG